MLKNDVDQDSERKRENPLPQRWLESFVTSSDARLGYLRPGVLPCARKHLPFFSRLRRDSSIQYTSRPSMPHASSYCTRKKSPCRASFRTSRRESTSRRFFASFFLDVYKRRLRGTNETLIHPIRNQDLFQPVTS